jgi:iron complex transport system permease protein
VTAPAVPGGPPSVHEDEAPPVPDGPDARAGLARTRMDRAHRARRTRAVLTTVGLVVAVVVVAVLALRLGDYRMSTGQVLAVLVGRGEQVDVLVVRELRLPRLLLGLLVGLGLGAAGAVFQSVLRNPLASPDVIGITQGGSAGAVTALLLAGVTGPLLQLSALAGGLAVGLLLYAVAWRGGMAGHRFVLAGIGVAYLATSVVGYVFTRAQVQEAQTALQWLSGSLAQASWELDLQLAAALAVLLPLSALVGPRLQVLLLGDDTAAALGLRTERVRLLLVLLGIALASVATAAAGPVAFVALTAAPIARRLLGGGSSAVLASALVGAVLVAGSDVVAQHLLPLAQAVPVGVVTGAVGGPYLIWLLATHRRTTEDPA